MAEFKTAYYGPMDREYHTSASLPREQVAVEKPIMPVSQLGQTVPEAIGGRNILQTTQAAIRGGSGQLQLVVLPPPGSPTRPGAIGARYGKEVRQALKEQALAAGAKIVGVEMPTSMRNLSGFDFQQNIFSEEQRKQSLQEVREALKFVGDVNGGGAVDVLSWEYDRAIDDVKKWSGGKELFKKEGEIKVGLLVDKRTGRTAGAVRKDEPQSVPYDPVTFQPTSTDEYGRRKLNEFTWKDFERWAQKTNSTPEERYVNVVLENQEQSARGQQLQYEERVRRINEEISQAQQRIAQMQGDEKRRAQQELEHAKQLKEDFVNSAVAHAQQVRELQLRKQSLMPIEAFAVAKTTDSYAEAGIMAFKETQEGIQRGTVKNPLKVGPEIGWPDYYGGHPDEFIKIVKDSRQRMVDMLTQQKLKDKTTGQEHDNPYFDPSINTSKAQELAKTHIGGTFDTSHLGMWLAHFPAKPGETEEKRVKRFNEEFFIPQVKKLADSGVVAGIQLVDSGSASHGHLPPGQGIFPVIETAKIFNEKGFKGFMVSEGHDEEQFGQGRITSKMWEAAGAATGYFQGKPTLWRDVQHAYFGKTYSPTFIFGAYVPSNDFRLWSEIPLE